MQIDGAYILAIMAGAGAVISMLFKLLMDSKDREHAMLIKEKEEAIASYKQLAIESVNSARETANVLRLKEGFDPIKTILAVVPESKSPPTGKQELDANIATLRANLASTKVVMGQEPRKLEMDDEPNPGKIGLIQEPRKIQ